MDIEKVKIGEKLWSELIAELSEFDSACQCFSEINGFAMSIYDHGKRGRNVSGITQELQWKISVSFYIEEADIGWRADNVYFGCNVVVWKDVENTRKIWNKLVWKGKEVPKGTSFALDLYESAYDEIKEVKESDLKEVGSFR